MSELDDMVVTIGCVNPVIHNSATGNELYDLEFIVNYMKNNNCDLVEFYQRFPLSNDSSYEFNIGSMSQKEYKQFLWSGFIYRIINLSYYQQRLEFKLGVLDYSDSVGKIMPGESLMGTEMTFGEYLLYLRKGEKHCVYLPWCFSLRGVSIRITNSDDIFNLIGIFTILLYSGDWCGMMPLELYFAKSVSYSYSGDKLINISNFLQKEPLWWTITGISSGDYCFYDTSFEPIFDTIKHKDGRVLFDLKMIEDIVKELGLDIW